MRKKEEFLIKLRQVWSPAVAVIESEEIRNLCTSGVVSTFTDLLRPWESIEGLNTGLGVPIRTPSEQPIRLYQWKLRFFSAQEMRQRALEKADEELLEMLHSMSDLVGKSPRLHDMLSQRSSQDSTPWFERYFTQYFDLINFIPHETRDFPLVCLLALPSSKASDAKAAFAELLESGASGFLKRLIQHGHTIVHHVILHDTFTGDDETLKKAQNGIASLSDSRKYLGNVLLYNSNAPPIDSNKSFGAFVEEFVVKRLAPHVESRIRMLDQTVMSTRRGLRNQLRSLWMKTSSSSSGGVMRDAQSTVRTGSRQSGTPNEEEVYDLDSPEVQLRCLCDLSMMVGDFDLACTVLRVLAADLKQDKAYFEYAWSQETLAVATILSSGTISEAIANFREAYHRYDQVAQQQLKAPGAGNGSVKYSSLYATRAAVMLADFLIALSRFNDASTILMKSHFQENDIRAALLLDRAAHLLLQGTKAQVRKFAFHMVLAGLRYNKAGAQELAARAYSLALEVYDKREWEIIEEHVHESLGKIYRDIGDISSASKHFGAILACASIPPQQQQTHITQYAETRGLGKEGVRALTSMDELILPLIANEVEVSLSGQDSFINADARQAPRDTWRSLEIMLGIAGDASSSSLQDLTSIRDKQSKEQCCVGEEIGIDIQLRNPLSIELVVSSMHLVCSFVGEGLDEVKVKIDSRLENARSNGTYNTEPFNVKEERITLHPKESAMVHLRVLPLQIGKLTISGIAWLINDTIPCRKQLSWGSVRSPLLQQRWSSNKMVDTEQEPIVVRIMPPMPRLIATLDELPETFFVGQMSECRLRLHNMGAMSLQGVRIAVNSRCLYFDVNDKVEFNGVKRDGYALRLPSIKLGVNDQIEIPVFIRPDQPGPFHFSLCFYYEPVAKLEGYRNRTSRCSFHCIVLPSLLVSGNLRIANSKGVDMLSVKAVNLQGVEIFHLSDFLLLDDSRCTGWFGKKSTGNRLIVDNDIGPESEFVMHARVSKRDDDGLEAEDTSASNAEDWFINVHKSVMSNQVGQVGLLRWRASRPTQDKTVLGFTPVELVGLDNEASIWAVFCSPERVLHDFNKESICNVQFNLCIFNSFDESVDVEWRITKSMPSHGYVWQGSCAGVIENILPKASHLFPLGVLVCRSGWIMIDGMWLRWKSRSKPEWQGLIKVRKHALFVSSV